MSFVDSQAICFDVPKLRMSRSVLQLRLGHRITITPDSLGPRNWKDEQYEKRDLGDNSSTYWQI